MNLLIASWLTILKGIPLSPQATLSLAAYVDDQKIQLSAARGDTRELKAALRQVTDASAAWALDTDQAYNGSKCQLWVSHGPLTAAFTGELVLNGAAVPTTTMLNHLGADIEGGKRHPFVDTKMAKRMHTVLNARWRLKHLAAPLGLKAHALAAKHIAKAAYGRLTTFLQPLRSPPSTIR